MVSEAEQLPVKAARAGDAAAWETLFQRYQLPLYVYVRELLHDEQTSLDIVQESFIRAARKLDGLREDEKFGSWLFSIAHQNCLQHWRKHKQQFVAIDGEPAENYAGIEEIDPQELLISKEQEREFMKLLDQLAPPHRSVLLLYFMEDFSIDEIARITGTSAGTVKSRMHYARKTLRKLVEKSEL